MIDDVIRESVAKLETTTNASAYTAELKEFIGSLRANLAQPEIKARYAAYREHSPSEAGKYPVDAEGYAVAFDPLTQEAEFWDAWSRYGIVVGKGGR
jgi:hypothetical protein